MLSLFSIFSYDDDDDDDDDDKDDDDDDSDDLFRLLRLVFILDFKPSTIFPSFILTTTYRKCALEISEKMKWRIKEAIFIYTNTHTHIYVCVCVWCYADVKGCDLVTM
uniref:Uncharacterized protein n=1 Tax=Noccaea caerulescens TaxID=107243 RepID=A0A1J3IZ38_NOCCA